MERGVTFRNAKNRKGLFALMNETVNPGILSKFFTHTKNFSCIGSLLFLIILFLFTFVLFKGKKKGNVSQEGEELRLLKPQGVLFLFSVIFGLN